MNAVVGAFRWIWEFVVGDAVLVGGVAVAMLLAWALLTTSAHTLHNVAGALFFVIIAAAIAVSLWREVGAKIPS